jgi:hypothetical protein
MTRFANYPKTNGKLILTRRGGQNGLSQPEPAEDGIAPSIGPAPSCVVGHPGAAVMQLHKLHLGLRTL